MTRSQPPTVVLLDILLGIRGQERVRKKKRENHTDFIVPFLSRFPLNTQTRTIGTLDVTTVVVVPLVIGSR